MDGYVIENRKLVRKADGIAPATFKSNVKHVAVFVRWCERTNLVETGVGDQIDIPNIAIEDEASHKTVSQKRAEDIRRYLQKFEYGTRQHAIFCFLWQTGCRISGAITLDLADFFPAESKIEFRDRKDSGTALKNGSRGERNVTLTEELIRVLSDYIEILRNDVRDDHDHQPLFTTESGRVSRQVVYKNVVGFTRPCVYEGGCPHNREIEDCEAARVKKKAYGCPSSTSMHPIRRGSITHHLNQGWPKEKVSERCDVSVSVLEKHYNEQSKEDERETRRKFIDRLYYTFWQQHGDEINQLVEGLAKEELEQLESTETQLATRCESLSDELLEHKIELQQEYGISESSIDEEVEEWRW